MKIGIVGCGTMGSSMARSFSKTHSIAIYSRGQKKVEALAQEIPLKVCENLDQLIQASDWIVLAIKPSDLKEMAKSYPHHLKDTQVIISILAGTSVADLRAAFPKNPVVRAMLNLPALIGKGSIGIVEDPDMSSLNLKPSSNAVFRFKEELRELMQTLGAVHFLQEDKMEAFTSLTGCGPAFVYVMIEAMIEAGVRMGLHRKEAKEFALEMLKGSIALLQESGKNPEELKSQIASPGGMTIEGLFALEEACVPAGIQKAFLAAYQKGLKFFSS